jgi:hypothetical protein
VIASADVSVGSALLAFPESMQALARIYLFEDDASLR